MSRFFDINISEINSNLYNCLNKLSDYYETLKYKDFQIVVKMNPNIGSMLIHNIFSFNYKNKLFYYKKCNSPNCNFCCYFSLKWNYIYIKEINFLLPIRNFSNCNSSEVVYIIYCKNAIVIILVKH